MLSVCNLLIRAHRVSWLLHRGPIPIGLEVMHECDRKPCVNPRHLRLGTHRENMLDALQKGIVTSVVGPRGPTHPKAKIAHRVLEIYERRAAGESLRAIGEALGVTAGAVHAVLQGRSYKDVPRPS